MSGKEIRFAVGSKDDVRSSVWRLWAKGDDVFLGARSGLRVMKISFHKSGICRAAIVSAAPRPALAKWKRPEEALEGFTQLFAVLVPPCLAKRPFHQTFTENKSVTFVQPPEDDQHKVVFKIALTPREITPQQILDLPSDREMTIISRIPLKSETLWLYHYYDPT